MASRVNTIQIERLLELLVVGVIVVCVLLPFLIVSKLWALVVGDSP